MLSAVIISLMMALWPAFTGPVFPPANQGSVNLPAAAPLRDYVTMSVGVELTAASAMAVDVMTNEVLYEKNPTASLPIASLTKLMTSLVFLDYNPGWQKIMTLESKDEVYRAKYIYRGEQASVKDLFYLGLVGSDNNAMQALVRSTGLTNAEFLQAMAVKAEQLDLVGTNFSDVTGLSADNVATAADLIKLTRAAWQEPDIIKASSADGYDLVVKNTNFRRHIPPTNKLLDSFLDVEAGKTGYTEEAGYCLASKINDSGHEILVVVLGSLEEGDRFQDTKALAWWVFNNYIWP